MFEKKFEQPKSYYVALAFDGKQPGDVVSYEELASYFPDGQFDRNRDRGAIHTHRDRMLVNEQRAIAPVRGVGYRVITAEEHLSLANNLRRESKRKARRSARTAGNFKRSEVSPEVAEKLDKMADRMSELERRLARQEQKTARLESQVNLVTARSEKRNATTEDRLARLERLLLAKSA